MEGEKVKLVHKVCALFMKLPGMQDLTLVNTCSFPNVHPKTPSDSELPSVYLNNVCNQG